MRLRRVLGVPRCAIVSECVPAAFLQGVPVKYLVLKDMDAVVSLVESMAQAEPVQELEEEEEEEEDAENNEQEIQDDQVVESVVRDRKRELPLGGVRTLTEDSFGPALAEAGHMVVLFYASWEAVSLVMLQTFLEVAALLEDAIQISGDAIQISGCSSSTSRVPRISGHTLQSLNFPLLISQQGALERPTHKGDSQLNHSSQMAVQFPFECLYVRGCHAEVGRDLFSPAEAGRTHSSGAKLREPRFKVDARKHFLMGLVVCALINTTNSSKTRSPSRKSWTIFPQLGDSRGAKETAMTAFSPSPKALLHRLVFCH
ncbi:Thioredoxin domain-containing protein 16 [Varanus komodoensis]|nr:Thioredoxin domain-containing protein 16 [Varanus komodoensis]